MSAIIHPLRQVSRRSRGIATSAALLGLPWLLLLLAGCSLAGAGGGSGAATSGSFDSYDDVLEEIAAEVPLARDVPPFPVPAAIEASTDPEAETAEGIIESVNGYADDLEYPVGLSLLADAELQALQGRDIPVLNSSGWQQECQVSPGVVYCTFTKVDNGLTLIVTEVHLSGTPGQRSWRLDIDGYDGTHHYNNFRCTEELMLKDLTYSRRTVYTNPDNDPLPPGPLWEYRMTVQSMAGEDLISGWTPGWSIAQRTYSCTTYIYNGIDTYYDWLKDVVVDQGGALLRFESWIRPAEWVDMYMCYMAIHNTNTHSGNWYTYDSSGTCTDSGSW